MKHKNKFHKLNGFTLLEVIVTLAVLALFSTALVSTFKQAVDTVSINKDTAQMYLEAKEALTDISHNLQSATLIHASGYFLSTDNSTGLHPNALIEGDQLHCISKIDNESSDIDSELCELGYWVQQTNLSNAYDNTLEKMLISENSDSSTNITFNYANGSGNTIASQIVDLQFDFLDKDNNWQTEWDSRLIGNLTSTSLDDGYLPKAVKTTIWVIGKKTAMRYHGNFTDEKKYAEEFTTIIYLPESKQN